MFSILFESKQFILNFIFLRLLFSKIFILTLRFFLIQVLFIFILNIFIQIQ